MDPTGIQKVDRNVELRIENPGVGDGMGVDEPVTRLEIRLVQERLVLSDFMPILENAGLRVISMRPAEHERPDGTVVTAYAFAVQGPDARPLDLDERCNLLTETILSVREGDTANDRLNSLVLTAGLAWREIDLLRAYCEYAFQLRIVPARLALPTALLTYPGSARALFEIFREKFTPADPVNETRARRVADRQQDFFHSLQRVSSLADDRALRRLLLLLNATVRTNYFMHGGATPTVRSGGVPYISFKVAGEDLRPLVRTAQRTEVWVQSPRMAGVHLRTGRVARGGLRHSDRSDDFRTEILGLVRTQAVKNAVIVPAGSKGGFVTRRQPPDATELAAEVEAQYRTLIRGLLDVTDNLVDRQVTRPAELVVHDEPDPYLVVAADKGTARFSDVANSVAADYGFWLDDAFASGGTNGYDHKAVGITARGAWECVRRHFWEMGRDTQTEPFTVVGIGDMSGDVFGNGMLLSSQIRLVAAFDHRHIFIDPDPDTERSFAERQRLFRLGRSSWADYDAAILSEGGFIVPRGVKEIHLSDAVRNVLGLADARATIDGESLIRAILRAPVDLLWNGGIGTYVKASTETHADAGDPANDAVRVDATALRCRVLGEGGNLGLTQRARVEFALQGGRCNTDAIDNSGGVDMSDHEVNLKILLNTAMSEGRLDRTRRNTLLREWTDAVTERVLHHNRTQSLALSLDVLRAQNSFEGFHGFMLALEQQGVLDRAREDLPSLEVLTERRAHGNALVRPELSVLLAYAKLTLKQALLDGDVLADPALRTYLAAYFPDEAVEVAGPDALAAHRLRSEIIATELGNDLVDLMGASFIHRLTRDTGFGAAEVARAWFIAAQLCGARELGRRLVPLQRGVDAEVVYRWLLGLARVLERTTRWVLVNAPTSGAAGDIVSEYGDGLRSLRGRFSDIVMGRDRELFEARVKEMQELTGSDDLATSLITLRFLDQLLEILRISRETGQSPERAGRTYYLAADLLDIPRLRSAIAAAAGGSRWDQRAAQKLSDELRRAHRRVVVTALGAGGSGDPAALVAAATEQNAHALHTFRTLLDDMAADDRPSFSALIIVVGALSDITR